MFKNNLNYQKIRNFSKKIGRLDGKVALITGGASGIGYESALLFANEGAKIICCDIESCEKTVDAIRNMNGLAIEMKVDVSNPEHMKRACLAAEKEFGGLHIVFNNAGVMIPGDDTSEITTENIWNKTFDINVKGVWFGCREALPVLRRSGGGSVINTASFVALRGAATAQLAYTSSKGAVLAMTRELAIIHARENIRFNALCPGPIRTDLLMKFLDTNEKLNRRLTHLPLGRFAEAKEIAYAALFLATEESSYITGSDFLVDGGLCAAYVTPE